MEAGTGLGGTPQGTPPPQGWAAMEAVDGVDALDVVNAAIAMNAVDEKSGKQLMA